MSWVDQFWWVDDEGIDVVLDFLYVVYVVVSDDVFVNEEWYYCLMGMGVLVLWWIIFKLRILILVGFEGGMKIYVNIILLMMLVVMLLLKLFEVWVVG